MIKTIGDTVKFLVKYIPKGKYKHPGEMGFTRMKKLVERSGNPQDSYKTIHVGGTSGKGSTATIIASILATKYETGLHTSPHLMNINERFKILPREHQDITDSEFVDLVKEIKPVILEMEKSKNGAPSYFEIITAMAFLYFKKKQVEFAVIEVGLGGTYDATNVINPDIAVLTNVGLDHTEILGDTVEKIARDKAGIIKKGIKIVTGVKQPKVIKIVEVRIKNKEARMSLINKDFKYEIKKITDKGSYLDYSGKKKYKNLYIPLLGEHQIENATLAIKAIEEFGGFAEENIREGLKNAFIQGRMEILEQNPTVILDGAHNPDKMNALVKAVETIFSNKKVSIVLAIKEDKKAEEIIRIILPIAKEIILTNFESLLDQGKVLSFDPEQLKNMILNCDFKGPVFIEKNSQKALNLAKNKAGKDDIILVTGSLYLVGAIRKYAKYRQD